MIIHGILSVSGELVDQPEASGKLTTRSGIDPYCDLTADGVHLHDSDDNQIRALL